MDFEKNDCVEKRSISLGRCVQRLGRIDSQLIYLKPHVISGINSLEQNFKNKQRFTSFWAVLFKFINLVSNINIITINLGPTTDSITRKCNFRRHRNQFYRTTYLQGHLTTCPPRAYLASGPYPWLRRLIPHRLCFTTKLQKKTKSFFMKHTKKTTCTPLPYADNALGWPQKSALTKIRTKKK